MNWSARRKDSLLALCAAFSSPSAYALMVVLFATVAAKTWATRALAGGEGFLREAWGATASDLLVYPAIALLVAAGERTRSWVAVLTYPLSLLAVVIALINAAYLAIANDQIDARILDVGFNRIDEVADIALLEAAQRAGRLGLYVLIALPLGYFVIRRLWSRTGITAHALGRLRIQGLVQILVLGTLSFGLARTSDVPKTLGAALLSDNAVVHTYITWLDKSFEPFPEYQGAIERHFSLPMVAPGAMQAVAESPDAPSVLVVLLESTRYDHVELPIPGHVSAARTPTLRALAERGAFFTNVHAALPHTSKSLISIFCGRLPAMENPILEVADGVLHECMPELFRSAGYATAFLQSAIGSFEDRPRMTVRLGYEHFDAFETINTPPLGYLAGDDRVLPVAFAAWLKRLEPDRRFFATVLTSGTHHPYHPPGGVRVQDIQDARARYAALVEVEDFMLSQLIEALRQAGRLERTLIVAVADHGEGLPGDPVRQHDNNFFEESLHVPMIIAGPGVRPGRYDAVTSLLDVAPTVLGTFGIETVLPENELRFGADKLTQPHARAAAPFACWNEGMCEGYVNDDAKVVTLPVEKRTLAFDRGESLNEKRFRDPTSEEHGMLTKLRDEYAITHLKLAELMAAGMQLPSGFVCAPGGRGCVHPSRPEGGFHDTSALTGKR